MDENIKNYIQKYSGEIKELYLDLRTLIISSVSQEVEEKLWAKLPSYYIADNFVRLIPFKDHINIEAKAIMEYKNKLEQFKITPKGMLQIYLNQKVPTGVLQTIFKKTLLG